MRRRDGRRGAASVDFALTAALGFVPLVMGTMEYSWYYFQQIQTQTAVQEALRTAVMLPLDDDATGDAETLVKEALLAESVKGGAKVVAEIDGEPPLIEMRVSVQVEHTALFGLLPTPANTRAQWAARMEDQEW